MGTIVRIAAIVYLAQAAAGFAIGLTLSLANILWNELICAPTTLSVLLPAFSPLRKILTPGPSTRRFFIASSSIIATPALE